MRPPSGELNSLGSVAYLDLKKKKKEVQTCCDFLAHGLQDTGFPSFQLISGQTLQLTAVILHNSRRFFYQNSVL